MIEIPNKILRSADVPNSRAKWDEIQRFALTFNGYSHYTNDGCARFANVLVRRFRTDKSCLSGLNLSRLRACLFYEQRRYRHVDLEPDKKQMVYIRALLKAIGSGVCRREMNRILETDRESRKDALVRAVKAVWRRADVKDKIKQLKRKEADFSREDFVWYGIVKGLSTLGSSRGYIGLIENEANYFQVTYSALQNVSPRWRTAHIEMVLRNAGVRYAPKKSAWLNKNLEIVKDLGGLDSAKEMLENAYRMSGKLALLTAFKGISKKYARNLMMDIYHPEFRNCIAVDARIKSVSKALGLRFSTFEEEELFYINAAKAAHLQPWEVDRIIYNFTKHIIENLSKRGGQVHRAITGAAK